MKIIVLVAFLVFCGGKAVYGDNPSRISYQDVTFSIFRTTGIVGAASPTTSNVSVSSGIIKIAGIYVSSPGDNSELRMYDNRLAGTVTNQIGVAIRTNARDFIPFPFQTERGLVFTSTATAGASWSQPSFNIHYIRIR